MNEPSSFGPRFKTHGSGSTLCRQDFLALGDDCVFEYGALIFHPENIRLGRNVYIGHYAIIKGYYKSLLSIGDESWIGQQVFMHAAGGIDIGKRVGIGPGVKILTSQHEEAGRETAVLFSPIKTAPVVIEDDADIGIGAVIMPGVTVGRGAIVGAGAVVTENVLPYCVVAGVPAKLVRKRP